MDTAIDVKTTYAGDTNVPYRSLWNAAKAPRPAKTIVLPLRKTINALIDFRAAYEDELEAGETLEDVRLSLPYVMIDMMQMIGLTRDEMLTVLGPEGETYLGPDPALAVA